jgi:hypothetical protein
MGKEKVFPIPGHGGSSGENSSMGKIITFHLSIIVKVVEKVICCQD